ncbi:hypothetical protein [Streptomyces rubellomurinus]|uniref:Uncharacterized protein n=2 Tax=Streptomyces TaxID=1883 RepID=A0A0F2TMI9_STRR3|nr:hypothetical protein [Streptomyces rubellomurinus]KJS57137.1 hypothetical protein VM98_02545 [Streptomyces rubellomurinus subsp. indigoferus]KJS62937.1 hypothetical protein VM95_05420 [Streptomyces rubellomurinus]
MARLTWTSPRTWTAVAGALLVTGVFGLATAPPAGAVATSVVTGDLAASGSVSHATCGQGTHLIGGGFSLGPVTVDQSTNTPQPELLIVNAPSPDQHDTWLAGAVGAVGAQAFALCEAD